MVSLDDSRTTIRMPHKHYILALNFLNSLIILYSSHLHLHLPKHFHLLFAAQTSIDNLTVLHRSNFVPISCKVFLENRIK